MCNAHTHTHTHTHTYTLFLFSPTGLFVTFFSSRLCGLILSHAHPESVSLPLPPQAQGHTHTLIQNGMMGELWCKQWHPNHVQVLVILSAPVAVILFETCNRSVTECTQTS